MLSHKYGRPAGADTAQTRSAFFCPQQIMQPPMPQMQQQRMLMMLQPQQPPPPAVVSVVHDMKGFGRLHAYTLPFHALNGLRKECARSGCDGIHMDADRLFDNNTLAVLKQGFHAHATALVKLADGYMMIVPACNNRVLSIIKDGPMCLPIDCHPSQAPPLTPDGACSVCYAVATPPGAEHLYHGFHAVFHNGLTQAHEISRFSLADHAIAQLAAAIPLQGQRVIMQSPPLGTLIAQSLTGDDADLIKQTFLGLVRTAGGRTGAGVYDVPIETSQLIAELLQLKNRKGQISLGRCKDGIYGYRRRKDGNNTFIFAASSDDFHEEEPSPVEQSLLHVFKMTYHDTSDTGPRIFVKVPSLSSSPPPSRVDTNNNVNLGVHGNNNRGNNNNHHNTNHITINANTTNPFPAASPSGGGSSSTSSAQVIPPIDPSNATIQDLLNKVESAMRSTGLKGVGCEAYPDFCKQEAIERAQQGAPVTPLEAHAAHELLSHEADATDNAADAASADAEPPQPPQPPQRRRPPPAAYDDDAANSSNNDNAGLVRAMQPNAFF